MASVATAPAKLPRLARRGAVAETVLVIGLVLLAAALRWPQLNILPPYTDETEESLRAWAIARGELRALTNVDAYVGSLWSYVVAGAFTVLGRSPEVPRLIEAWITSHWAGSPDGQPLPDGQQAQGDRPPGASSR